MKLIAYSLDDVAGCNIAGILRESFGFRETEAEYDGVPVYGRSDILLVASRLNITQLSSFGEFSPEVCIVVSRHRSESGRPTLTTHATGNFGPADVGGMPGMLSLAPASYLRKSLEYLLLNPVTGYDVSLEVTHHGPTQLPFPLLYVEVGSSMRQWNDVNACTAVAEAADALVSRPVDEVPACVGFGGPHYAPNFTKTVKNVAYGHIMPKYVMEHVDKLMVEQMIMRTVPRPKIAVLDWKGLRGADRRKLASILESLELPWKKTSQLKD